MSDLRALTKLGEAAMAKAEREAKAMLGHHASEVVRSYVATGLLAVALKERTSGVPRDSGIETLREALIELGGSAAFN